MRQLDMQLHRCDAGTLEGDVNENWCADAKAGEACRKQPRSWERHRLQVVLRLLHVAILRAPLPDFEFRVCLDDTCHGVWERPRRPRALFTMASCLDSPTIPMLQWNANDIEARDPDLAVWAQTLQTRVAQARAAERNWACREDVAVFRGSANQLHTYNNEWTDTRRVRRVRTTADNFNVSGRWALVEQKRMASDLLNVRLSVLRRAASILGKQGDDVYRQRLHAVSSDEPASLTLAEQAARFKYVVHAEGHGGWADRLKYLLLSGAVVLKQDSGVNEWFEPSLQAGVHYLAVRSDLGNLSAVVTRARRRDRETKRVGTRAVEWAERTLATPVAVEYAVALFVRYAGLVSFRPSRRSNAARYQCWPAVINESIAGCAGHPLRHRQLTECSFAADEAEDATGWLGLNVSAPTFAPGHAPLGRAHLAGSRPGKYYSTLRDAAEALRRPSRQTSGAEGADGSSRPRGGSDGEPAPDHPRDRNPNGDGWIARAFQMELSQTSQQSQPHCTARQP